MFVWIGVGEKVCESKLDRYSYSNITRSYKYSISCHHSLCMMCVLCFFASLQACASGVLRTEQSLINNAQLSVRDDFWHAEHSNWLVTEHHIMASYYLIYSSSIIMIDDRSINRDRNQSSYDV